MQAIPSSEEEQEDVDLPPAKEVVVVEEDAAPKLVLWQGVALLTADCLGVGVLALPHDIKTLGWGLGFSFLIANFPINYYAGNLLSVIALDVEDSTSDDIVTPKDDDKGGFELTPSSTTSSSTKENDGAIYRRKSQQYSGIPHQDKQMVTAVEEDVFHDEDIADGDESPHLAEHEETSTSTSTTTQAYDLISITKAVFGAKYVTRLVVLIYYMNLFLVLGDYVLVMGRAVSAIFLDEICLPTAGAIASLLMFAVCQLRTMANLGRKVSLASLLALLIVLLQCIFHHRNSSGGSSTPTTMTVDDNNTDEKEDGIWQRFSAFASIGFAVGSQKLFLNIRHELQHREEASQALAWSLTSYGFAYVLVILLAGSSTCSFVRCSFYFV
jgi:amino acid permease